MAELENLDCTNVLGSLRRMEDDTSLFLNKFVNIDLKSSRVVKSRES